VRRVRLEIARTYSQKTAWTADQNSRKRSARRPGCIVPFYGCMWAAPAAPRRARRRGGRRPRPRTGVPPPPGRTAMTTACSSSCPARSAAVAMTSFLALSLLLPPTGGAAAARDEATPPHPRDIALHCPSPALWREFAELPPPGSAPYPAVSSSPLRILLPPDAHVVWTTRPMSERGLAVTVCAPEPNCTAAAEFTASGVLLVTSSCTAT
jgi:hypothetical protein